MVFQKLLKSLQMVWPCSVILYCECPFGGCHTLQMLSLPTASKATGYDWFVSNSKAISIIACSPYRAFPIWVSLSELPCHLVYTSIQCSQLLDSFRIWRSFTCHSTSFFVLDVQEAIIYLLLGMECPRMPVTTIVLPVWPIPESLGVNLSSSLTKHRVFLNKASDMLATSHSH